MSDPLAELRETFFLECDELLEKLEADLLALESGVEDDELVNSAFRAVHSIKGGAGAFGMSGITDSAHVFETALDHVRSKTLDLDPDLCALFLRGKDLLAALVEAENGGPPADEQEVAAVAEAFEGVCPQEEEEDLSDIFKPVSIDLGGPAVSEDTAEGPAIDPLDILAQFESGGDDELGDEGGGLIVAFAPKTTFYERGNDPAPFIRELCALGEATVLCDASKLPSFDELVPTSAYFEWTIQIAGDVSPATVEEIFEFVADDCVLTITRDAGWEVALAAKAEVEDIELPDPMSDVSAPVTEELAADAPAFIDFTLEDDVPSEPAAASAPDLSAFLGEDEAEPEVIKPAPATTPAKAKPQAAPASAEAPARAAHKPVVRVELSRVDRLINLVSELVISQSMLTQAVEDQHAGNDNTALSAGLDEFRALTRELQESVMAIRAEPVRSMFMRMSQIVRSTASACDKKVKLVTEGETTEVDKTVIERLTEPLTHMIRNAVDHGIESAEKRLAAGKSEQGIVRLSADHQSGRVVIKVVDDGGGINRKQVLQKAVEKGIVPPDTQLTDAEIDQLLFAPGFSTAASISQVSGRGVGMDVVKREIYALGGRINISSVPGEGTTFTISLPLTLAVLDGMVIRVAEQTVVLPLNVIAESLRPEPGDIQRLGQDNVIFVRGRFVPILDIGAALGYRAPLDSYDGKVMLLIENDHDHNFAFAVDEIVDQRQVVIKGLQDNYGRIEGVAAATILGDGQIALILDVNDLTAEQTAIGSPIAMQGSVKEVAHG
ncbi:MAG: chemotaxis protein CheA [Parvularcula sp.]|jgi:two-component system chemotaxis sensor kinase CheA|nr:chemotaxis protein CheA [Parvularcula sp.]